MENSIVSSVRVVTAITLAKLQSDVNDAIAAVIGANKIIDISLDVRPRRSSPEFVATLKLGLNANNVRGITAVFFYNGTDAATIDHDIDDRIALGQVAPLGYGIPIYKPYMHRDARWTLAMLPVVSYTGGNFEKVHAVNDSVLATATPYLVLGTDEIVSCTTTLDADYVVTLPDPALNPGRTITVVLDVKHADGGVVKVQCTDKIVISTGGAPGTEVALTTEHDSVQVQSNGVNWYVRNTDTAMTVNETVLDKDATDGAIDPYVIGASDQIISCTTGLEAGRKVHLHLPDATANINKGRKITVIYAVKSGAEDVTITAVVGKIIGTDGTDCTLCKMDTALSFAIFESNGVDWYAIAASSITHFTA
jgi:hypothetical protein